MSKFYEPVTEIENDDKTTRTSEAFTSSVTIAQCKLMAVPSEIQADSCVFKRDNLLKSRIFDFSD